MANKENLNVRKFFKSKLRKKYFANYIFTIFFLFVFSVGTLLSMAGSIKRIFDNNNKLIVDTVATSLNDVFKKVDNVYKTLEVSNATTNFFEPEELNLYNEEALENNTAIIKSSVNMYDFIEEIVLIKKDKNYLITSESGYNKDDFFNTVYNSEEYKKGFFENIVTDYLNVKMIPATTYKNLVKYPAEDPKKLFVFVKTYSESNMNILIFVPEDSFIKAANLSTLDESINLKVYDYNNSVVFSNTDEEFYINTKAIGKDFKDAVIDNGTKRYHIIKSSYNYFYYVAKINNHILLFAAAGIVLLLFGFIISVYYLMKKTNKITKEMEPLFKEVALDNEEFATQDVTEKIRKLKEEISESKTKVDTMSDEIKSSTFIKLINSSSFYTRNRKTVELVFEEILERDRFFILSVETIKENNRFPRFDIESISAWLNLNLIQYVHIEEKTRKNLYVIALSYENESERIISNLSLVFEDIRKNGIEILACHSKEFKELNALYDAYRDIRICRDYRGIDDKLSVLNVSNVASGNVSVPINFKEELTGKILANEEEALKEYAREIIDLNIKNNIPLSKFEFMLRQMLSTVTEAISSDKKGALDVYELEQVFLLSIDNLKDNFDVTGIINSFINFLHLTVSKRDIKKNILNRTDVIKYINSHYEEDLYLEKIATEFSTTPKYFSNYFKKEFMIGFNEHLTQVRISHAKKLLLETELSLPEISKKVGYQNQATFAAAFKKTVGTPPGKYREMNKKEN